MTRVLITGGNGGIAQEIEKLFRQKGYDVFAPSHNEMDVTDWDSIKRNVDFFIPDILINNAGYVVPLSVKNADLQQTKRHIDINLGGVFYCTEIVLKKNPEAMIINIGSAAAVEVHATWSEYCATKAAVVMATKCWAEDGIYAVSLSPGRTRTKMRKALYPEEDQNTLLDPQDFAKVVLKAAQKEFMAGENIIVKKDNVKMLLEN